MNDYIHCYLLFTNMCIRLCTVCLMVSAVTLHWWASLKTIPSGKHTPYNHVFHLHCLHYSASH